MSVSAAQVAFVRRSLLDLNAHFYRLHQRRAEYLRKRELFSSERFLGEVTEKLFGPRREYVLPTDPRHRDRRRGRAKILLLELQEMNRRPFHLVVFRASSPRRRAPIRCFIGHRFTGRIEETFRHNMAELSSALPIRLTYGDFDGAAVELIGSLRRQIAGHDFCLFDNRDTTRPSKPNVYIEAGMAFASRKPFVMCHYHREVWPSDFAGVTYVSYDTYRDLFRQLYLKLPGFIRRYSLAH